MDPLTPPTGPIRARRFWLRLLPGVALIVGGCAHSEAPQGKARPPEVFVGEPITAEVTDYEDFTGRTEAKNSVDIRARVSGYLAKSYLGTGKEPIHEGWEVEEGQVLFEIDPTLYQAALEKAEADVELYQAQKQLLDAQYERNRRLLGTGAVSRDEFDTTVAQRSQAVANIASAKAQLKDAKQKLDWTKVTAPLTGRISRRMVDPGNLVKADDTLLTNIVSQNPMFASFDVDEHTMLRVRRLVMEGRVKSSREAEISVWMELADEQNFPHEGTINFVDNKVDAGTGTLRARAAFANPRDESNPKRARLLSPGMFVRIRVPIGTPHKAILVAEQALGTDQGQKYVYVLNKNNEAEYRRVTVGGLHQVPSWRRDPESALVYRKVNLALREILPPGQAGEEVLSGKSGLALGERIVVNGLQRVRRGAPVTPVEVNMADLAPAAAPAAANKATQTARK